MRRVPNSTLAHVSASPPLIRYSRISRAPLAAAAFPEGPSLPPWSLSARPHTLLRSLVIPSARQPWNFSAVAWHRVQPLFPYAARHLPRAPLPVLRRGVVLRTSVGITPTFFAPMGSCAPLQSSNRLCFMLLQLVFAGCGEPLLEGSGSQCYLHNPCIGAWSHTSSRPSSVPVILAGRHRPHITHDTFGS